MQDPSFSEMALDAVFESINAAQKSLLNEKNGLKDSANSLKKIDLDTALRNKKPGSNVCLNGYNMKLTDSQNFNSGSIGNVMSSKMNLSKSQEPYSETAKNRGSRKGIQSILIFRIIRCCFQSKAIRSECLGSSNCQRCP